ncbi:MAG: hypothetical protein Q6M54_05330 [Thermostichus sp. DRC_bins_24]
MPLSSHSQARSGSHSCHNPLRVGIAQAIALDPLWRDPNPLLAQGAKEYQPATGEEG